MSIHEDWPDPQASRPGMSSATKIVLILVGAAGVCVFLCCGGLFIAGWGFAQFAQNAVTREPERIRQITSEMVQIEIPPGFEPDTGMDMKFMRMVSYRHSGDSDAQLTFTEGGADGMDDDMAPGDAFAEPAEEEGTASEPEGHSEPAAAKNVDDQDDPAGGHSDAHGAATGAHPADRDSDGQPPEGHESDGHASDGHAGEPGHDEHPEGADGADGEVISGTVERTFEVAGKPLTITEFTTTSASGKRLRNIMGTLPGKRGPVSMMLVAPAEQFDDAKLERMLKSVRAN